ncbi:MAG: hypothetical protein V3S55_03980 [Nitrospiraceae bacterium]
MIGWKKCDDEECRVYVYADGIELRVDRPVWVDAIIDGLHEGHYIIDHEGSSWHIVPGWLAFKRVYKGRNDR